MSSLCHWALMSMACVLLCACVRPIHQTDEFTPSQGVRTLSIDAKQRIVLFSPDYSHPKKDTNNNNDLLLTVTCAEPSPDALSALSTSLGTSLSDAKVAANLALAQAESAASIGLRTQSIQLLRDGMYRLCEGYAGGAIDSKEFNQQQRRYQNLMLSLLAIEQLTGAVVARQVGLGQGSSSAAVGDKADEAAANLAQANSDVSSAQAALKKAQDTQTSDEKACTASASSPACGNASADKSAVTDAQTALDKAKAQQKTAQDALQAARGSVNATAAGAQVSISDATTTNKITDASAQAIAEATRTIVSTTLLASNAQEDCNNVWYFLQLPADKTGLSLDAVRAVNPPDGSLAGQILHMAKNCQTNEERLLGTPGMFTPLYNTGPLQVLNAGSGITLAPKDKAELFVVGGLPPYHATQALPDTAKEVTWSLQFAEGNTHLIVTRPPDAVGSGKATASVLDSANAHVDVPITYMATAPKAVAPAPAKASVALAAPTSLKATSANGEITVTFTPSKSKNIKGYAAFAIDTTDIKSLTASGDASSKSITLKACVADRLYAVSVEVTDTSGHEAAATMTSAVKCVNQQAATPSGRPSAAKNVQASCKRGTIEVKFDAPSDGGSPVLIYSASARNAKSGGTDQPLTVTSGKSPILIPGCAKNASYTVAVIATNANGSGPSASASATCSH